MKNEPKTLLSSLAGGKKRITTIQCGPVVRAVLYSIPPGSGIPADREERRKLSREQMRLMKRLTSWQKLDLLLSGNMRPGDIYATFTFDSSHYPKSRDAVKKEWTKFKNRLLYRRKKNAQTLIAFWAIQRGDLGNRWHIHAVINFGGETEADLSDIWGLGRVKAYPLERDTGGGFYTSVAKYLARFRPEKLSQRSWSHTLNIRKPERDSFFVDDAYELSLPDGCIQIEKRTVETNYGNYEILEYEIPNFELSL